MSERVLLAERHTDSRYECFRSQFADTTALLRTATEGDSIDELRQDDSWTTCGRWDCQQLLEELSYLNLDLCIECEEANATAFLPVWGGIPTGERDQTPANCGVLLRVASVREYDQFRRQLQRQKARLGVATERGELDIESAQQYLLAGRRARIEHASPSARRLLGGE